MERFQSLPELWEEDSLNRLIKRFLKFVPILGLICCAYALFISIKDQNWSGSFTIVVVMLAFTVGIILTKRGRDQEAFRWIAVSAFIIIIFRISVFQGVGNLAFYIVYPLIVMIGVLFRDKPKNIARLGLFISAWLFVVYVFDSNQIYSEQIIEISTQFRFIIISISILLLIIVLQITARNSLVANQRLVGAKEDALQAQAKAESANQAKSTFLANMSHELRTPLNAIIGYSEMIGEVSHGEISEDSKKIELSAKSLLGILNSILEISRIEANMTRVDRSEFDLHDLVNEVSIIVSPQIQVKGNQFEIKIQSEKLRIMTDRQKLMQILINLLGNANKFTPSGKVQLGITVKDSVVVFKVSDSGIGIPRHAQAQIFEPFQQVDNQYNRLYDGAGLGLAICKQFTQSLDGELEVASQVDKGTTFTLTLPA